MPILFLFVAEALSICTIIAQQLGRIRGITLLGLEIPYVIGGFVDDTHFLVEVDQGNLYQTTALLDDFSKASGLNIQWAKSATRWLAPRNRLDFTD